MKNLIKYVFILFIYLTGQNWAQQEQFVIGAYMHSTPWGNTGYPSYQPQDSALFSLWRAKALGINTAMVYVRQPDPDPDIFYEGIYPGTEPTNMEALRDFPNVIAMNTYSAYRLLDGIQPNPPNKAIRNFDYIYFYSGAYYSKWDATIESLPVSTLGLSHQFGEMVEFNGKTYWSSGANPVYDSCLVKGPNYLQETRYRSSTYPHPWANEVQTYRAYFNLLLHEPPDPREENDLVCEIIVYSKYTDDNYVTTKYETLDSRELTAGQIGQTILQTLEYNYSDYCQNAWFMKKGEPESDCNDKKLIDIEFQVKWLGNSSNSHELLIDYIEIYDFDIWQRRLSTPPLQNEARIKIANYLNKFKTENPQFYTNNLKYFYGVDEPHTVDAYLPHAFVQSVLDSLHNVWSEGAPQLFTHFYPEWNGYRNNEATMPRYINAVNPKPFHFYFAPFRYGVTTEESLSGLRNILQRSTNESGPSEELAVTITSVNDYPGIVSNYRLYQHYPNPFNPSTKIGYKLKERGYVKLYIYDIKGELVSTLVNGIQEAGYFHVEFTGERQEVRGKTMAEKLASGIYIYQIMVKGENNIPVFTDMKKMILLK
jgi:hypothetical protein